MNASIAQKISGSAFNSWKPNKSGKRSSDFDFMEEFQQSTETQVKYKVTPVWLFDYSSFSFSDFTLDGINQATK